MASVGDVISLAETVSNYVTAVKDRFEKASENPRLISELLLRINDLKTKTAQVEDIRKANEMDFTTTILAAFDNEIRSIYQSLEGVYDELQSINAKLKSRRYRYVRANTVSTWLFEQFAEVSNLDKELLKLTMFFANAEVSAKVHRTTDAHLKNIASSVENPDKFRSSFHVPRNPPHVILKFGSNSEMSPIGPREVTLEAQLKQAIIRRDRKKSVGAIGSTTGHPVGMKGMSGVGKSCALRGLATDREVRERFPDGIYWLSLGKDCTVENIVRGVARITEQSGGIKIAKAIRDDADIEGAVSKGEQWFAGKRGLLLIDDVWDVVEIGRDIVRRLSQIVDAQKGSRVAFTTRDLHVAVGRSELIEFSSRNRVVSRQILLKAANVTEEDVCNLKPLVDDTLDLCAGLPMALSVAGSAVRMKREICPHVNMTQIWLAYVHVLRSQPGKLTRERATDDRYQNLRSAFQASLSMLDEKSASAHEWDMSYHEMYRALAVIQRQGWLPVSVLHLLWRLKDEFEAEEVVDKFTFASLAELKIGTMNGNKSLGISLHDLQLEFVEGECKLHGEEQKWHDRLVCAWRSVRNPDFVTGITEHSRWAVNQIFEDQYVRQNVCRHIVGAGRASELGDLVLDPEWAVKRLVAGEIFGLEGDLKVLEKNYKNSTFSAIEQGSVAWSVRMMAGAARLSAPYIAGSMREVYFQLYARLCDLRRHSELLQKYSSNIEKYAARPWLKAIRPCLSQPGGALREILTCEFRVDGISASCRGWIAWGVDFGKEISYICTFVRGQLEKKVMLRRQTIRKSVYDEPNSSREICKLSGERGTGVEIAVHQRCMWYSHIDVICCSEDARYAVTAYGDGAMQVWDLRSEERIGGELHGHSGRVLSIVWSPDKMRFASGGSDAKVKIWEQQTGKIVGRELPLLPSRFCSSCCMAWSPDGKRLSYTGDDDIAKIWDFATGKAFELHGEHNLRCMSWSKDGLRLACGGRGHVSIWNTSTIEKVIILESNERQFFFCIAWSPNGNRLAAAADGDKVGDLEHRNWDTSRKLITRVWIQRHTFAMVPGRVTFGLGWSG